MDYLRMNAITHCMYTTLGSTDTNGSLTGAKTPEPMLIFLKNGIQKTLDDSIIVTFWEK